MTASTTPHVDCVGDADELHEFHRTNGVEIVAPPEDRPHGLRD